MTGQPRTPEIDVASLVRQAQFRRTCWRQRLVGPADEYMRALEALEVEKPGVVVRREVHRALNVVFKIRVARETISGHFRGDCTCGRSGDDS